jgi:hypothetical protein
MIQKFWLLFFGKIIVIRSRANGAAGSRIHINLVAAASRAAKSVASEIYIPGRGPDAILPRLARFMRQWEKDSHE